VTVTPSHYTHGLVPDHRHIQTHKLESQHSQGFPDSAMLRFELVTSFGRGPKQVSRASLIAEKDVM
jgi:hypothetical protein